MILRASVRHEFPPWGWRNPYYFIFLGMEQSKCRSTNPSSDLQPIVVLVTAVYNNRLGNYSIWVRRLLQISYLTSLYSREASPKTCTYSSQFDLFSQIKYAQMAFAASWGTQVSEQYILSEGSTMCAFVLKLLSLFYKHDRSLNYSGLLSKNGTRPFHGRTIDKVRQSRPYGLEQRKTLSEVQYKVLLRLRHEWPWLPHTQNNYLFCVVKVCSTAQIS